MHCFFNVIWDTRLSVYTYIQAHTQIHTNIHTRTQTHNIKSYFLHRKCKKNHTKLNQFLKQFTKIMPHSKRRSFN